MALHSPKKEAPYSCGAGECTAIEKREAHPIDIPFAPRQECRGSLLRQTDDQAPGLHLELLHARDLPAAAFAAAENLT